MRPTRSKLSGWWLKEVALRLTRDDSTGGICIYPRLPLMFRGKDVGKNILGKCDMLDDEMWPRITEEEMQSLPYLERAEMAAVPPRRLQFPGISHVGNTAEHLKLTSLS